MKKVSYNRFGGTEVLQMVDTPMPEGEVIVKVKAASINPLDWKLWQGDMKLMSGRKFPKYVGIDFAGVVEKGNGQYRKGDAVFGMMDIFKGGALAEYVAVTANDIARKPEHLSFAEAAGLPVVGSAALQIFNQLVPVRPGMRVLINGAAGGIGLLAIQLAKGAGATVTSVTGPGAVDAVSKLGSDVVVNYKQQDILTSGQQFDAVIDLSGKMAYGAAKKILAKKGVYVNTSPGLKEILGSKFSGGRYKVLLLKPSKDYLEQLATGGLQVLVSKQYNFADYRQAYDAVQQGGVTGKAVFIF